MNEGRPGGRSPGSASEARHDRTNPSQAVGWAQCRLLSISRSSFYYAPVGETAMNFDPDAADRQAVPGHPVLRCPPDDMAPAERGDAVNEKAHPAADAPHAV